MSDQERKEEKAAGVCLSRVAGIVTWLVMSSHIETLTPEQARKLALLAGVTLMGSCTLFFFGIFCFLQGDIYLGSLDLFCGFLLVVNLVSVRFLKKDIQHNSCFAIGMSGIFYMYLYLHGGYNQTGFVWYYTFPLFASYLLGAGKGLFVSLFLTIPVFFLIFFKPESSFFADYDLDFEVRFIVSYLVACAFAYFHEYSYEINRGEIRQINDNLEKTVVDRTRLLRKSEAQYRNMFEKSANAIFLIDRIAGKYIDVNPAAEILTGRDRETLLFLDMDKVWSEQFSIKVKRSLDGRDSVFFDEVEYISPDGVVRKAMLSLVKFGQDKVMGIAQDITDLRQAEQEKVHLQTRLMQAEKMEAIGNLAGGIAHDFNNILVAIIGFTELALEDAPDGSEQQESLQEVLSGAMRASKLVNQILTYARQRDVLAESVCLTGVIEEVSALLRSTLPVTIELKKNIREQFIVKADETQLHQVVMNLCANAAQSMKLKGGTISIDAGRVYFETTTSIGEIELPAGRYVALSVSDTGIGIEEEMISSIFEPYFTTKEVNEGTGMGLAVVKGIVEDFHGAVTVKSEPGVATVFTSYFPDYTNLEMAQAA